MAANGVLNEMWTTSRARLGMRGSIEVRFPNFRSVTSTFSSSLLKVPIDSFCEDLRDSDLLQKSYSDLNTLVEQYDRTLLSILDKPAPEIQRQITVRPSAPWYTQEVADEKNKGHRLKRKWQKSRMQSDRECYVHQCYVVNNLICNLKTTYYREPDN